MSDPITCESRYAQVAPRVRLHYLSAGDPRGPLVVLLHGFPEFSGGWRHQIGPLADAGFHVVAPDQRGYNLSDKPIDVASYSIDHLVNDVVKLIRAAGHDRATVVGHDWGGVVAWHLAMHRPDVLDNLVILNAPHPAAYRREIRRGKQLLLSWYALLFQLPWLPEVALRANDFAAIRKVFRKDARRGAFTCDDVERSIDALRHRKALTGALNYYRAALRPTGGLVRHLHRIRRPTLLLWGMRDSFLSPRLTRGLERYAPRLTIRRFYEATHWLHHEIPVEVNAEIIRFIRNPRRPLLGALVHNPLILEERSDDHEAIREVNRRAFDGEAEGVLVDRLRAGGYARVSLVAEVDGRVVGHILFSDLPITTANGTIDAVALAPIAVVPEHQRNGIGSALVRAGLDACRAKGFRAALVLGHRAFYPRFGFSASIARQIESRYAGEDFMAVELVPGSLQNVSGRVNYPPPFDEV